MPTSRTLVRSTAPAALLALALAACPRAGQKDDAALAARLPASAAAAGATGDAASIAATGRAAALLDRGSRYAVQLFAAPDRVAARDKLAELQQLGLTGIIASADLGLRGQWYRVLIGNHGRRDLAELRGRALVADPRVRALLPTPPAGDPGYVVRDDVAPPLLPGPSLAALERLAAERELAAVPIWTRGGGAPALAVIFAGDPRLRLLDATGVLGAPLPLPRFADCRECLAIAAAHRARAASVLLAEDMSGDGASELLLALDHGAGHRLAALSTADRGGQLRELGTLVLDASEQVPPSLASIELVDADGDPAAELLVVRRTPVTHEG
ncbi:MAG: SPOR domain-containing protein, partial [Deltaproteobacteria bacterium]|nr:SPOR domain-containing protein [Deltaproteobacteria bacterium]